MTGPVPGMAPETYAAAATDRCGACGGGWGNHARGCQAAGELADVVPLPVPPPP